MAQEKGSIAFNIFEGGKLVREVTFSRPIINIGKLSTSNLRLEDVNVSRKHAVVERLEDGRWRVTDLGSTNGVAVNGERVTQAILRNGFRVLLGNTTLVVGVEDTAGAAGASPSSRPLAPVEEIEGLGQDSFYRPPADGAPGAANETAEALEVALLWGETVLSIQHYRTPTRVVVGDMKGCQFTIPKDVLGHESVPLVAAIEDKFGLNVSHPAIQGDVLVDESVMPVAELSKVDGLLRDGHLLLNAKTRARIRFGEFIMLVSCGPMPAKPRMSALGAVDYTPHIYVALSAIIHIACLVILSLMPEEQLRSRMDPAARRARLINVLKVTEPEPEDKEEDKDKPEDEADKADSKDKDKDDLKATDKVMVEPKEVKKDNLLNKLARQRKERPDDTQTADDRRRKAKELAQETAAKVFQDSALFDTLLDSNDQGLMHDGKTIRALGSVGGAEADPFGGGAVDPFGGTLGGGGTHEGFVGSQSIGSDEEGGGGLVTGLDKGRAGRKLSDINLKDRPMQPVAIASTAKVSGRLDRNTVQSIIRRNLSGIKWCYQDALQRNPNLRGKVTLSFVILHNGHVQNPTASNPSVNDPQLLQCITRKMSRWRFPSPKDGGIVKVTYPLILKTR